MLVNDLTVTSVTDSHSRPATPKLREMILSALEDDKADDITFIDLSGKCDFADFMVIASGRSQRHVQALATKLADRLKQRDCPPLSMEGLETSEWVLIDTGDIIVHIFHPEKRAFYNLEKMWEVPMPNAAAAAHGSDSLVTN